MRGAGVIERQRYKRKTGYYLVSLHFKMLRGSRKREEQRKRKGKESDGAWPVWKEWSVWKRTTRAEKATWTGGIHGQNGLSLSVCV